MNNAARWGALIVLSGILLFGSAAVAGAQDATDPYIGPSPTVDSAVVERGVPSEVAGQSITSAPAAEVQGTSLAFTGGDVGILVGVAFAALLAGGLMVVARRRNETA